MTTSVLIVLIVCFVLAAVMFILSICHFMERGYLLNNNYLYASAEERKRMDKKPYYRQSAIVFLLLSFAYILIGLAIGLHVYLLAWLEIPLMVGIIAYAVISSVHISQSRKP